jgi:hypothetical protein
MNVRRRRTLRIEISFEPSAEYPCSARRACEERVRLKMYVMIRKFRSTDAGQGTYEFYLWPFLSVESRRRSPPYLPWNLAQSHFVGPP